MVARVLQGAPASISARQRRSCRFDWPASLVPQVLAEIRGRYFSVFDGLTQYRVGETVRAVHASLLRDAPPGERGATCADAPFPPLRSCTTRRGRATRGECTHSDPSRTASGAPVLAALLFSNRAELWTTREGG